MNQPLRFLPLMIATMLLAAVSLSAQLTPQITVNPETVDFGNVRFGDTLRRTIVVSNTGTVPLTGTATAARAYYVVDSGAAFTVPANSSRNISVRFIPTRAGMHADSLVINHNATNRSTPIYVTLRARVDSTVNTSDTSVIVITPTSVDFGTVTPGQTADRTVVVRNNSNRQIAGTVGATTPPFVVTSGSGAFLLSPGQSTTITVRFAPTVRGTYNDNLPINYTDSAITRTKYVALRGTGDSVATAADTTLTANPSRLDYGNVPLGESYDRSFVLRNTTNSTIAGSINTPNFPFATIFGGGPFALAPGATRTVVVRFSPVTSGSFSDSVVIAYTDTASMARTLAVQLTGSSDSTARPSDTSLVIQPTFLDFGTVRPGDSQRRSFTIRNQSTRPVTGLVGTPSAPFVITRGAGPFVIAPNEIITVDVQFTPGAAGDYSSFVPVSFLNQDSNSARTVNVVLRGRSDSTAPSDSVLVDATPSVIEFGPTPVGSSADRTFTIRNRSNGPVTGGISAPTSGAFVVTSGSGPFTLAPGESRTVTVRFSPTANRRYEDSLQLVFVDNAGVRVQGRTVFLGGAGMPVSGISFESSTSGRLKVSQSYPNPTSGSVRIDFEIASAADVTLDVYSIEGNKVATLIDGQRMSGSHSVAWTPQDVPSGTYIYRLRAGDDVAGGRITYQR